MTVNLMPYNNDEYKSYVEHPRYGKGPNITGLDMIKGKIDSNEAHTHWRTSKNNRIPNTAIPADIKKQTPAMAPVTHYFDEKRHCRDCDKPFIFFAMEQKHWFEVLGFMLDADAVRCVHCRKIRHGQKCKRQHYEELYHISNRTVEENIELANCCMALIEEGDFYPQKTEFVRMLLNKTPDDCKKKIRIHFNKIRTRLEAFENRQENS